MQNTLETKDLYTKALNEIVQGHSQNGPDYFISNIIFTDDYAIKVNQK